MPVVDQVVLDSWNGRPSIWMSANKGDPFLHWMLLGHNELFDLWIHARLTPAVADHLAEHPEENIDDVLTLIPSAPVRFVLEDSGRPLLFTDWDVPAHEPHLVDGLRVFAAAMTDLMEKSTSDREVLKIASSDVESLLA
jgi:hypothetical protein